MLCLERLHRGKETTSYFANISQKLDIMSQSGHDYTQYNLGEMLAKGLRKLRKGGMKVKVHFEVDGTVSRKPYNILQLLTIVITVITPLGNNLSREGIL